MPKGNSQPENNLSVVFGELGRLLQTAVRNEDLEPLVREITATLRAIDARITKTVQENKGASDAEITSLRTLIGQVKEELSGLVQKEKEQQNGTLSTSIETLRKEITEVKGNIPALPDYTDLFGGIDEKLSKLEQLTLGENVRNALEVLPEGEKLAIDAIEGLREILEELRKFRSTASSTNGGGIVGRDIIKSYDLSDQLDGVLKTFNLPGTWYVISVVSSSMPHAMRPTIDFTWTPQSITFTDEIDASTILSEGQTVIVTYVTG